MAVSTGLKVGPYDLTNLDVSLSVQAKPGAYVLGHMGDNGLITVCYVGRADADLRDRLWDHVNTGKYTAFKCDYSASALEAYRMECQLFHLFGGLPFLDNLIHPDRPSGTSVICVHCP